VTTENSKIMTQTIIHIKELKIESDFTFKLRNFGHLHTNTVTEINNYTVKFKSLLPKEFCQRYLSKEKVLSSLSGIERSFVEGGKSPEVLPPEPVGSSRGYGAEDEYVTCIGNIILTIHIN